MNHTSIRIAARALAGQFSTTPSSLETATMLLNFDTMYLQGPEGASEIERLRALPRDKALAQIVDCIDSEAR